MALLVSGPTASGKSAAALELAERLGGEIVSADSMQVFRGLDIGTAKPSAAELQRIPHHVLDLVDAGQPFDAAQWLAAARAAVADVQARGRTPILCGGTGLYFRAWLLGIDAPAPSDPDLRAQLEALPLESLVSELSRHDPSALERIDAQNPRRVVRAVEILRLTGRVWAPRPPVAWPAGERVFVLRRTAPDLRRRIDRRVEQMFQEGLVEETRRMLAAGLGRDRTALQAIGYRQVVEWIAGKRDLPATLAEVKARTWQMARRQMTWFRHQLPTEWIDVAEGDAPAAIARAIQARASASAAVQP